MQLKESHLQLFESCLSMCNDPSAEKNPGCISFSDSYLNNKADLSGQNEGCIIPHKKVQMFL
jgi:hypothetical protein